MNKQILYLIYIFNVCINIPFVYENPGAWLNAIGIGLGIGFIIAEYERS